MKNESEKKEIMEQLALICASLIHYNVESGSDFLHDEDSVELTKYWVQERINNAELFLEMVQVEEISKVDFELLNNAIENIVQFKDETEFKEYQKDLKSLKLIGITLGSEGENENTFSFKGFEGEEAEFSLSDKLMRLIEKEWNGESEETLENLRIKYIKAFEVLKEMAKMR